MALSDPNERLEIFDTDYYKFNKKCLTICGVWPRIGRSKKIILNWLFTIIVSSLYIPTIAGTVYYFRMGSEMQIIQNILTLMYLTGFSSKYYLYRVADERILQLYHQISKDWTNLTDEKEKKILHEYTKFARFLSYASFIYAICAGSYFFTAPFLPLGLDRWMPLKNNETRFHIKQYQFYYFDWIDAEKYYYECYLFHGTPIMLTGTMVTISIDIMVVANIQHICALFHIVGYRLRKIGELPDDQADRDKITIIDDKTVIRQIKHVCDMHRTSIKSIELLQDSFGMNWLIFLGITVSGMALIVYSLIFLLKHPLEIGSAFVIIFGVEVLLLYINWIAQKLNDSSKELFIASCEICWYNLSIRAQKLVCFMLQNNINPINLKAGEIIELNYQQFVTLTKTWIYYTTIMLRMNS